MARPRPHVRAHAAAAVATRADPVAGSRPFLEAQPVAQVRRWKGLRRARRRGSRVGKAGVRAAAGRASALGHEHRDRAAAQLRSAARPAAARAGAVVLRGPQRRDVVRPRVELLQADVGHLACDARSRRQSLASAAHRPRAPLEGEGGHRLSGLSRAGSPRGRRHRGDMGVRPVPAARPGRPFRCLPAVRQPQAGILDRGAVGGLRPRRGLPERPLLLPPPAHEPERQARQHRRLLSPLGPLVRLHAGHGRRQRHGRRGHRRPAADDGGQPPAGDSADQSHPDPAREPVRPHAAVRRASLRDGLLLQPAGHVHGPRLLHRPQRHDPGEAVHGVLHPPDLARTGALGRQTAQP